MFSQKRNCAASFLISTFIHLERFIYIPTIDPPIFLQPNRQTDSGSIQINHRNMNVEIRTEAAQFVFCDYFLPILVNFVAVRCTLQLKGVEPRPLSPLSPSVFLSKENFKSKVLKKCLQEVTFKVTQFLTNNTLRNESENL
jgi:hypothetical protein